MPYTSMLYGRFAVEFGVFVPHAYSFFQEPPPPKWPSAPHCAVRSRLQPTHDPNREWTANPNDAQIGELTDRFAPALDAYFDKFGSVEKLRMALSDPEEVDDIDLPFRPPLLLLAALAHHDGDPETARSLIQRQIEWAKEEHPGHAGYCMNLLENLD